MQQLSQSLAENLSALDARFGKSADYYAKKIVLYGCPGCIVMFDGMASLDSLWELLLDAAGRQSASVRLTGAQAYAYILHGSAFPAESAPVQDLPQLVARLTAGMAVLLLEGCSSGIVFSVQGLKFRSVGEPSGEGNLRGSREGFADLLRVNLSLLRRLIRSEVEDALATCLLDGTLASGDTAVLTAENGTLCVRRREKAAAAALGDVGAQKA